ncbi:Uncharacterised protein [Cedecea neteri]|nr:DUF4123 domain-containing protein [Cedecea neteri]SQC93458.1 Uncharacterised protein [Cedecea neteri]
MNYISDLSTIKKNLISTVFGNDKKTFLLVDATLETYGSEPDLFEALSAHKNCQIVFSDPRLDGVLPLYLVPLDSSNENSQSLFEISVRSALASLESEKLKQGKGRCVCAWLSTQLNVEQLSKFIANTAMQNIQNVGDILLRFYDPSVLSVLLGILDPWQCRCLLDNVDVWCYIDGDGMLRSINGNGRIRKLNYSLGLSESSFLDIKNVEIINKILLAYRDGERNDITHEAQAINTLLPALRFFSEHFEIEGDDVVQFGIDTLTSQAQFYLSSDFTKYFSGGSGKLKYKDVKNVNIS